MTEAQIEKGLQCCKTILKKLDFKREIELDSIKEAIRKETAKEILGQITAFLNKQSESVNSMTIIPPPCKDCYDGSQHHRYAFIKELAQKYGVEVEA